MCGELSHQFNTKHLKGRIKCQIMSRFNCHLEPPSAVADFEVAMEKYLLLFILSSYFCSNNKSQKHFLWILLKNCRWEWSLLFYDIKEHQYVSWGSHTDPQSCDLFQYNRTLTDLTSIIWTRPGSSLDYEGSRRPLNTSCFWDFLVKKE